MVDAAPLLRRYAANQLSWLVIYATSSGVTSMLKAADLQDKLNVADRAGAQAARGGGSPRRSHAAWAGLPALFLLPSGLWQHTCASPESVEAERLPAGRMPLRVPAGGVNASLPADEDLAAVRAILAACLDDVSVDDVVGGLAGA